MLWDIPSQKSIWLASEHSMAGSSDWYFHGISNIQNSTLDGMRVRLYWKLEKNSGCVTFYKARVSPIIHGPESINADFNDRIPWDGSHFLVNMKKAFIMEMFQLIMKSAFTRQLEQVTLTTERVLMVHSVGAVTRLNGMIEWSHYDNCHNNRIWLY